MLDITHLFIDFDGVLTDNFVYVDSDGMEVVRCSRADGIGLEKLKKHGIKPIIISTETDPVVSARARKLRIECVQGVVDKLLTIKSIASNIKRTAFMGNDVNDYEAMYGAGYAISVADARYEIKEISDYVTKARGGYGAVREACGWILSRDINDGGTS